MEPIEQHCRRIRRILIAILILNWSVAAAKVIYGLVSRSASMTADGFHSFSDGTSNIIGLIGISLACRPRDKEHPYGHKKYETLFSMVIAAFLFFVAFNLIREGIMRFIRPVSPDIGPASFIVMLSTLAVNLWVMRYELKKGRQLQSDILISDSMHTRADIFTSLSVILSLAVVKMGYPVIDPVVTIFISLFIAYAGANIVKEGSAVLCDAIVIVDVKKIEDIVLGIKGVKTCHKIRTRGRPDDICLDLHVQVHPDMHVDNAHRISYAIEDAIKKSVPGVTDVVVHIEPLGGARTPDSDEAKGPSG
ncbi:MAG: cation transporter [Candidatus Omnitrophica bacterium]|nr:cation transporter [Candidatus Omnitrophota bacterium]